jgi:hypothetical protein
VDKGRLQFLGTIDELREKLSTRERSLEQLYLNFTAGATAAPDNVAAAAEPTPASADEEHSA